MASTEKRGKSYRIVVSLGYDIKGKQIKKQKKWTPSPKMSANQIEKELEKQAVIFEEECRLGRVLNGKIHFSVFADKWFKEYAEKQLKASTLSRYRGLIKRINQGIGHLALEGIRPHHLMEFYDNLGEIGVRDDIKYSIKSDFDSFSKKLEAIKAKLLNNHIISYTTLRSLENGNNVNAATAKKIAEAMGKPLGELFNEVGDGKLSAKTIGHYHRLISSILSVAVQWQVIISNPCDRAKPPKVTKKIIRFLDEVKTKELLDLLKTERINYRLMITLLIFSGFRRGELLGLEWGDIDFDNERIYVRRNLLYLSEKGTYIDTGKTNASIRDISISESVIELLRQYKEWQDSERIKLGDRWVNSNRLFTSWCGESINPGTLGSWFRRFTKKHELDINIHGLRHTNATLLIAAETPLPTVADRLGHGNPSVTSSTYTHAIPSRDEIAAKKLEDILS